MPPADSLALIEFIRRVLSRLDAKVQQLVGQYARAEDVIVAKMLVELTAQKVVSLREQRRKQSEVNRMLRMLDEEAHVQVPQIVQAAADVAQRINEKSSGERPGPLSVTNREAVKLLAENLIEDLNYATLTVGRNVEDIFRKEALHKAQAVILGEQPKAVASAQMKRALDKEGITAFYDSSGRQWTLTNYTGMATETVAAESVNRVQETLLEERGLDIVQINESPKCCDECREFDGKTFSLTGRAKEHPVLKVKPPFHGRCHHVVFPSPLAFAERESSGWVPLVLESVAI